ncbi:hypothetical protein DPMN_115797 [Dreissena polymorpha]|uniref:Reverse transcriptase domain-containing protein n=1 Tax=Dreissena polymorpha TaxID=45954 RepID=A0A9D4KLV6_DREPO|nr:hypothetical protein DPMN_115797 [Dreissena polymorpha]
MLRIILNRLKSKAEQLLTEEQAGFKAGRSSVEQIFNAELSLRNTCNTNKSSSTTCLTSRKLSNTCGMMA